MGEQDGEFQIIWTRPPPPAIQGSCSMQTDALYATRIGINRDSLAVDLRLEAVDPDDPATGFRGKSLTPRVSLVKDGCRARAPEVFGLLAYGGADGRIVLRRAQLPKGDLMMTFRAFGREHTVLLANDDQGLRTIVEEEMSTYRILPGDPLTGEETTVGHMQVDCPDDPAPEAAP